MTKKPAKPKQTKAPAAPTPDGEALWARIAAGVKPLPGRHKNKNRGAAETAARGEDGAEKGAPDTPQKAVRRAAAAPPGAPPPARDPGPELSHTSHPGLDKATATKLRQGKLAIDGVLDLHGMTQQRAHAALGHAVENAHHAGRRVLLAITGKGAASEGGGVLRRMAPRWLNEPELRRHVLAFCRARPKDGGDGALYVLIKRKR